eukprot:768810-Hanusia_phi.AAC.19
MACIWIRATAAAMLFASASSFSSSYTSISISPSSSMIQAPPRHSELLRLRTLVRVPQFRTC